MNGRVDQLLNSAHMLVLMGSGGVGKTTISASLGLRGAQLGHKVLVITIDPARRLATSLGLKDTGNEEVEVMQTESGSLHALMLDARSTFDDLIKRVSPDPEVRERIYKNRLYRLLADSLAGSQNPMATEKLFEVSSKYELVILDTPPTSNALDFFDSGSSLIRFLDDRVMRWFLPGGAGGITSNLAIRLMSTLLGRSFMDELLDFFDAFGQIYKGFRQRAQEVGALLRQPSTHFGVVCRPETLSVLEADHLVQQVHERGHLVNLWFANRCSPYTSSKGLTPKELKWLDTMGKAQGLEDLPQRAEQALEAARLGAADEARLLQELGPDPKRLVRIPRSSSPIVELPGLEALAKTLSQA